MVSDDNNSSTSGEFEAGGKSGGDSYGSSLWKVVLIVVAVLVLIIVLNNRTPSPEEPDTPAVVWHDDYAGAIRLAQEQNKPALLAFHAEWCASCQQMKRTAYHDPAVIEAVKDFIPIIVDTDKQESLAQQYGITFLPTYIVTDPRGVETDRFVGFFSPSDFIGQLKIALAASQ